MQKERRGNSLRFPRKSEFALNAALVLCANGIKTYLYEELQPHQFFPLPSGNWVQRPASWSRPVIIRRSTTVTRCTGVTAVRCLSLDKEIIQEVNQVESFEDIRMMTGSKRLNRVAALHRR